ncbi:GyrI-like domain-containing protein [Alkalihalobacillus trypoxylicola]|nr:GyrI-like domain-containing protein [Alkalihalobacillus trypoxylicola]
MILLSQYDILTLPSYRAMGMKWTGKYENVKQLKEIIDYMEQKGKELKYAIKPDIQLGLSYHVIPDGFEHYSVFEVSDEQPLLEGLVELHVPELTYLITEHLKGEDIGKTYDEIASVLKDSEYIPYKAPAIEYFDSLPIKHERYPVNRDKSDPQFQILIPIMKK